MWLVSISKWSANGANVPIARWSDTQHRAAKALAHDLLHGVGNPDIERGFAMVATLCVHRAVTDSELAHCPDITPSNLAGPAAAGTLWQTDAFPPLPLSAQRCENNTWVTHLGVRLPGDCTTCPPCLARQQLERP